MANAPLLASSRLDMADSVTQLQEQINTLCQLMYNYAGSLQRDAKPVRKRRETRAIRHVSRARERLTRRISALAGRGERER